MLSIPWNAKLMLPRCLLLMMIILDGMSLEQNIPESLRWELNVTHLYQSQVTHSASNFIALK
jgi:hypothetical protein